MARVEQSLALAKEGLIRREMASSEPYLGRHTREYYAVLEEVQGLAFDPGRDASAWVEFCIEAHVFEAKERRRWLAIAYARHGLCAQLAREQHYPDRLAIGLDHALLGLPLRHPGFRPEPGLGGPPATPD